MSYETVLLPKFSPDGTIILANEQFHNSYTFWAMPILISSPVQIIMTHPLAGLELLPTKQGMKQNWKFIMILSFSNGGRGCLGDCGEKSILQDDQCLNEECQLQKSPNKAGHLPSQNSNWPVQTNNIKPLNTFKNYCLKLK